MITKESTAGWSREKWQDMRRSIVTEGGSDAAVVVGLNPHKSPYALWAEKTGMVTPEDISDKEAVRLGNDLEEYVARRWAEKTGKKVRRENAIIRNSAYPFAHANVDRMVVGERAGLECKTTSNPDVIKTLRDGKIPDQWYCQVMHYMLVCEFPVFYLAALAFGDGFYEFTIQRDEVEINALIRAEQHFFNLVESRQAPPVDGMDSTLDAIGKRLAHSDGRTIDGTGAAAFLQAYASTKQRISELEKNLKEMEANIKAYMGEAEKAVCPGFTVWWKTQGNRVFDRQKWEAEHGVIPEEYFKKYSIRPFKVTVKESK